MDQKTDQWFIVVTCQECQSTIFLFRDLNNGKGSLNATYDIKCPECNHKGSYEGRHYQEPSYSASSAVELRP